MGFNKVKLNEIIDYISEKKGYGRCPYISIKTIVGDMEVYLDEETYKSILTIKD